MKEYENFISETLDKHFEIICDCKNEDFYEDDGHGALNLSLHSSQWSSSQKNNDKKKKNKNITSISMEERRNNAEKAIYMLMDMFGLDENEEEEKEDEKEEK